MIQLIRGVGTKLASSGLGTLGSNLFLITLPSSPYSCTVVAPTGGLDETGNPTRTVAFMVQCRNTSATSGYAAITSINALLNESWNILDQLPGRIAADAEIGGYFVDDNEHFVFPANYTFYTTKQ